MAIRRGDLPTKRIKIHEVGAVFERLTVVEYLGTRQVLTARSKYKLHEYSCACSCGKLTIATHHDLSRNYKKSCGCLRNELASMPKPHKQTHGKSGTVEYNMWSNAKRRALKSGVPFNIDIEDIFVPEMCPILGIPLSVNANVPSDSSPSLDRVNPVLGYTKDNINVISYRANRLKNSFTHEELLACLAYVIDGKETYKQKQ